MGIYLCGRDMRVFKLDGGMLMLVDWYWLCVDWIEVVRSMLWVVILTGVGHAAIANKLYKILLHQ